MTLLAALMYEPGELIGPSDTNLKKKEKRHCIANLCIVFLSLQLVSFDSSGYIIGIITGHIFTDETQKSCSNKARTKWLV